jgi:hypothetical protein
MSLFKGATSSISIGTNHLGILQDWASVLHNFVAMSSKKMIVLEMEGVILQMVKHYSIIMLS